MRASLQRVASASARKVRQAWRDFQNALQADRRRRVQDAGTTIDALM